MASKPRKAPARFLTGAPDCIIDIFDNGGETLDRYTFALEYGPCHIQHPNSFYYLATSETGAGFSQWDEWDRWQLRDYRRSNARKQRVAWDSLSPALQQHVRSRLNEGE